MYMYLKSATADPDQNFSFRYQLLKNASLNF